MNNNKVHKSRISSKFNTTKTKFHNRLEKQLREYASNDVICSCNYWNEDDPRYNVKNDIMGSVIKKYYKERI